MEKYNVKGVEKCLSLCKYIEPKNAIKNERDNVLTQKINVGDTLYFPLGTVSGGQTGVSGGPTGLGGHNVIIGEVNLKSENGQNEKKKDTSFLVRLYHDDEKREEAENLREKKYVDNKRQIDNENLAIIQSNSGFLEKLYNNDEKNEKEEKIRENNFVENEKKKEHDNRVMVVMEPFFQSKLASKSTLQDLNTLDIKSKAVQNLILTMVEMLNAGVAGSDLQPLINTETGILYVFLCI